jgi:hypothetical protein
MPNQRISRITTDLVLSDRGHEFSPTERHPDDSSLWRVRYADGHIGIFAEAWLLEVANASVPYGPEELEAPEPSSSNDREIMLGNAYEEACLYTREIEDAHTAALAIEINTAHFFARMEERARSLQAGRELDISLAHADCLHMNMDVWHSEALRDAALRDRSTCPSCQERYAGRIGRDHRCNAVVRAGCGSCGEYQAELLGTTPPVAIICQTCVTAGYIHCRKCGAAVRPEGKRRICNDCIPQTDYNIWDSIQRAIGNDQHVETGSARTFAVEVETVRDYRQILPNIPRVAMGNFHWVESGDGSVRASQELIDAARIANRSADIPVVEFKSPPFIGDAGLVQLFTDVTLIRNMGFRSNSTCGVHVHVGGTGIVGNEAAKRALFKFGKWYEDEMYRQVDPSRRQNQYSRTLPSTYTSTPRERYYWLNLSALRKHGTVEIRMHHGCTIPSRITEWAKLCLKFVEAGLVHGRARQKPDLSLYDAIGLSPYEKIYWQGISANLYPAAAPAPSIDGGND